MKKKILLMAIALMSIGITNTVMAQATATQSANASAKIITPIDISKDADMSFGNIGIDGTVGTVILAASADGSRTEGGGAFLPATTGTVAAAEFTVSGENSYTYTITIPTGTHTITHTNATDVMTVSNFTSSPDTNAGNGELSAAGSQTVYVGATLNLVASQQAGTYTSLTGFNVVVNYN